MSHTIAYLSESEANLLLNKFLKMQINPPPLSAGALAKKIEKKRMSLTIFINSANLAPTHH